MTEDVDSKETRAEDASDKEKEYKFLKPEKGTGSTKGVLILL